MPTPLAHERTFRIRHYECDAYGHVNHANYLRYMQETAFDASAAAGFDMQRYEEMGTWWWIRETAITYLAPLTYGDTVTVKTWVADFKRVHSRRDYMFYHAETGAPVAEAYSDWVYLDRSTQRPIAIPQDMKDAFFPEGVPEHTPKNESLEKLAAPPPGVFNYHRLVKWHDLDVMQHVNNAVYVNYLEEASFAVCDAYGWPLGRMNKAGFGIMARRYHIEYKQSAQLGDELDVATWVSKAGRTTAYRHYTIHRQRDRALVARATALWVWVDLLSGRPIRIPEAFIRDFETNITS